MKNDLALCSLRKIMGTIITCCLAFLLSTAAFAQSNDAPSSSSSSTLPDAPAPQTDSVKARDLPMQFLKDQKAIWTSPARIRVKDLDWLVPMAAVTGVAIATDRDAMVHVVPHDAKLNQHSLDASNAMLGALLVVPAVDLGVGMIPNHEHARETGLLSAESAADAAVVEQVLKLAFWRERPGVDNSNGKFWQRSAGVDSSFPSSHSVFAWSTAAVVAEEYPSRWKTLAVYALATGVSATRVVGQEHFPSDVIVGSAAGWLVGHYVYKLRHRWQKQYDE